MKLTLLDSFMSSTKSKHLHLKISLVRYLLL